MTTLFENISHPIVSWVNEQDYWLTKQIAPVDQRMLIVEIAIGVKSDQPRETAGIKDTYALEIKPESDVVRIEFRDYVSYSVTEEMFAEHPDKEVSIGRWLRIFSKSFFLDFVKLSTWATSDFPGELIHYQVNTLDHTVNIVTANPPEVLKLAT